MQPGWYELFATRETLFFPGNSKNFDTLAMVLPPRCFPLWFAIFFFIMVESFFRTEYFVNTCLLIDKFVKLIAYESKYWRMGPVKSVEDTFKKFVWSLLNTLSLTKRCLENIRWKWWIFNHFMKNILVRFGNIINPCVPDVDFLYFLKAFNGRERVHWKQMG